MKTSMKAQRLLAMLALACLQNGCIVHEHSATCGHYYGGGSWHYLPHHVHGPDCGHVFSGGIWVTAP